MYKDLYSEGIVKKLVKLKKKDPVEYLQVRKKMDLILADPHHSYKFLTHDMKSLNRVHLGHFVLVFRVDHENETVSFECSHSTGVFTGGEPPVLFQHLWCCFSATSAVNLRAKPEVNLQAAMHPEAFGSQMLKKLCFLAY